MKNSKTYDCVAAKHIAAQRVHKKLKGMSVKERLAFWQAHEQSMRTLSRGKNKRTTIVAKVSHHCI